MINIRSPLFTAAVAAAAALFATESALAAATDITNSPMVSSSSISVKPNLMFILDDSGSMARNYIGDNANDSGACRSDLSGGTCSDGGDLGNPSSFAPPFMAKEFNGLAYNPANRYLPPIDYDGTNTTFKSYDNSAGYLWTAVKLNPFSSATTYNLTGSFPERWFCDAGQNSSSDRVRCRRNLERMIQPSLTGTVDSSTVTGPAAGLFTITVRLTVAKQSGAAAHGCAAGDALTVSGNPLAQANGSATSGGTNFRVTTVVSTTQIEYRYTNAANTQPTNGSAATISACHQVFPVSSLTRSTTTATLTLNNHGYRPGDTIKVAGASNSLFNGQYTVGTVPTANTLTYTMAGTPASSPATNATNTRITVSSSSLPLAQITRIGTTATATFQTAHGCVAGDSITVTGAAQAAYNVTATVTGATSTNQITYTVAGSPATPATQASPSVPIRATPCSGAATNYSTSSSVHPQMQGFPQGAFTTRVTVAQPVYYTIQALEYCTSQDLTNCQSTVATATNPFPALVRYCASTTAQQAVPASASSTSNNTTTVATTTGNSGCQRAFAGSYTRPRYGYFTRQAIEPATTSYTKAATRTDCVGATCTYAEEITNFANWFAYYRARMLMMKSSSGLAFNKLNPTNANATDVAYRVGFHTINNTATRNIAPFAGDSATSQKANWYSSLYATPPGASTPLRQALARVGRYFAGSYAASAPFSHDPMEYSCQQNLAFLTTDGFWNGLGGVRLNGTTAVGDQDGASIVPAVARPFLDSVNSTGGDGTGTLADVAFYYYNNDLRTSSFNPTGSLGGDVTANNVPPTAKDPAAHQHMTTYTMGLGLDSLLVYAPNYDTAGTSPDFNAIVSGTRNWPAPAANAITAVDDLWHAAVNGRGTYFSAKDPAAVIDGLTQAFNALQQITGTAAAAATSNPNIVSGDNFLFASTFTTVEWFGDVTRQTIDLNTGAVSATIDWSAQARLDASPKTAAASDTRTIYTFDSAAASKLKAFTWANLSAGEKALFDGTLVPHFLTLTGGQQSDLTCAGCGAKIVEYIRGQRQYEASTNSLVLPDNNSGKLFRKRAHVLGDIVSAEAVYVKRSPFDDYVDPGHQDFRISGLPSTRPATLYVAANDGMLHAFDANNGEEMWAYIPSQVLPKLVKLTDKNYQNAHQYFVDGTPTAGDICTANCSVPDPGSTAVWKTILVGGFNAGSRGYYALDITNPTVGNVKVLWELTSSATCIPLQPLTNLPVDPVPANTFSDCDLGLSFGNPIITKRADGKWVVLVTSGYNNTGPGTGGGFLYVIDAATGAILNKIATLIPEGNPNINAGDTTTPSGLARINAFASNTAFNNTALRIYGGDLNGNLWRFDNTNTIASSGNTAKLLAFFGTANGAGTQGSGDQPIQSKPELGEVITGGLTYEMVFVGTGKYLGTSDLSATGQQSFYAVRDRLTATPGWGAFRTLIGVGPGKVIQQTLTETINPTTFVTERRTTADAVDLSSVAGWVVDFNPGGASPGERSTTDPTLDLGTLTFTTNVPSNTACTVGGSSFLYFLDYATGGAVPGSVGGLSGQLLGQALATRPVVIRLPSGKLISLTRLSSGATASQPIPTASVGSSGLRINWREVNMNPE